jgi:hypothetical protein
MDTRMPISQFEVREISLFYFSQVSCFFHQTAQILIILRCRDTPELFVWIMFSCASLITHPKIQSPAGIAWFQVWSWLAKIRRATNESYSVAQQISIVTQIPHPST